MQSVERAHWTTARYRLVTWLRSLGRFGLGGVAVVMAADHPGLAGEPGALQITITDAFRYVFPVAVIAICRSLGLISLLVLALSACTASIKLPPSYPPAPQTDASSPQGYGSTPHDEASCTQYHASALNRLFHGYIPTTITWPCTFPSPGKTPEKYLAEVANCKQFAFERTPYDQQYVLAHYDAMENVFAYYAACMIAIMDNSVQFRDGSIRSREYYANTESASGAQLTYYGSGPPSQADLRHRFIPSPNPSPSVEAEIPKTSSPPQTLPSLAPSRTEGSDHVADPEPDKSFLSVAEDALVEAGFACVRRKAIWRGAVFQCVVVEWFNEVTVHYASQFVEHYALQFIKMEICNNIEKIRGFSVLGIDIGDSLIERSQCRLN